MSVLLDTSEGELVIDLFTEEAPKESLNFLKLCKHKYYDSTPFYNLHKDLFVQSGNPNYSEKQSGGSCIWGMTKDATSRDRFFNVSQNKLGRDQIGLVFMITNTKDDELVASSEFGITLSVDTSKTVEFNEGIIFGTIAEGFDTLEKINSSSGNVHSIKILETHVLDDPFDDVEGLISQDLSQVKEEDGNFMNQTEYQALTLELMGDIPHAGVTPPENVLFICRLNPVTQAEDLKMIFSRFGPIVSCNIIKDKVTGESLKYGFIEYENKEDCEKAYLKMDDILIDDYRIHVDFSQSVRI